MNLALVVLQVLSHVAAAPTHEGVHQALVFGNYHWLHQWVRVAFIEIPILLLATWDRRLGLRGKLYESFPPTLMLCVVCIALMPPDTDTPTTTQMATIILYSLFGAILLWVQVAQITRLIDRSTATASPTTGFKPDDR